MKVRHFHIGVVAVLALAAAAARGQTPVLGSIEAPYGAVQGTVHVAGGAWGAGSVAYGPVGTPLVLSGSDLGTNGTVTFIPYKNGVVDTHASSVTALPTMWTASMIFVPVPAGALTGMVQVKVEGKTSNLLPFIVMPGSYSGQCPAAPPQSQLQIVTTSLRDGTVQQSYSATLGAQGGTQAYTWSLIAGTLPAGLSLNASTGTISGTPTASTTSVSLTFEVTDSSSPHQNNQAVLDLTIEPQGMTAATVYSYCVPDISNPNPNSACTVSSSAFDGDGNIHSYIDTVMGTWNFTYDALNRVQSGAAVSGGSGSQDFSGQNLCWAYDSFGNRTAQVRQTSACPSQETGVTPTLTFDTSNHVSGGPLGYDPAGDVNTDSSTGNSYLYDGEGRVCAVKSEPSPGTYTITGYLYDAEGTRIAKGSLTNCTSSTFMTNCSCDPTANGFQITENYVLGLGGEELSMLDGNNNWQRTNVYAGGKLVGTYDSNGLHFHLEDPLGTRRMQLSGNTGLVGQPETDIQSFPYGDGLYSFLDQYAPATADDATPLHFTGKERDTESGNDYFGARYYSSSMGRFLSPDWSAKAQPVPYAKLDDPQTLNLYGYLRNNPLGGVDADGHCGGGANDPPCQKLPDNPASHVSADTKAQIKDAVAATKKPSGDDKKGGFHEEAGISYTKDGKQVQAPAQPGPYHDPTTPGPATSDPYKTANPSLAKPGDVQADVDYHTHPNGSSTSISVNSDGQPVSTTSSFVQAPSAVDIQNASPAPTINLVVGTGNNTAYFYTGAGVTCTESLKDFYKPQ